MREQLRKRKKTNKGSVLSQLLLIALAVVILYPLFFVILTSLKSNYDVMVNPFGIASFEPGNYIEAWRIGKIGKYFLNSVIVVGVSIVVQMVIVTLASYSFGKLRPWGHNFLFLLYLSGLFITSEMITVPNFVTMKNLEIAGTHLSLILPYISLGISMATYIMTNYIKDLPKELDEAALIDGCGVFGNFWNITLPLTKPVMATVFIFNFQSLWSEFYWVLIMVKDEKLKTLPLGLMNFQSQFNTHYGVLCAGLSIAVIPVLILYVLCSNYFIGGMTAGAVKG